VRFREAPILLMHPQKARVPAAQGRVAPPYLLEIAAAALRGLDLPSTIEVEFFLGVRAGLPHASAGVVSYLQCENGVSLTRIDRHFLLGSWTEGLPGCASNKNTTAGPIKTSWRTLRPFPGAARRGRRPNHCQRLTARCPGHWRPLRW